MRFFLALCLLLLQGCGIGHGNKILRIGVDPEWYPLDFGAQQAYVNGFTEELLLEIARYSGIEFEYITANWDSLLQGLQEGKYDTVLSSLPPYPFNEAKYDFSQNFLDLGPVLIVSQLAPYESLEKMRGGRIGILMEDPAQVLIQKRVDLILRTYSSLPELFNALVAGEIDGAVHSRIPAVSYVRDLYAGKLKVVSASLTDAGLHLIAPKGKYTSLVRRFNANLEQLKEKETFKALLQKWQLGI